MATQNISFDTSNLQNSLATKIDTSQVQIQTNTNTQPVNETMFQKSLSNLNSNIETKSEKLSNDAKELAQRKADEAKKQAEDAKKQAEELKAKAEETIKKAEDLAASLKGFKIPRFPKVAKFKPKDIPVPNKEKKKQADLKKYKDFIESTKSEYNKTQQSVSDYKAQSADTIKSFNDTVNSSVKAANETVATTTNQLINK